MKRKLIILTFSVLVLLIVGISVGVKHARETASRNNCLSVLRSTGAALGMYCENYNGNLPPDFALLEKLGYMGGNAAWYVCPWGSKKPGNIEDIEEWMDYVYIPWPSIKRQYAKYPLMYDRRMSNHSGKGINILLVEQVINTASPASPKSFHGQFFWDEGAQWLQKFANEHPRYSIPLPEDLKK